MRLNFSLLIPARSSAHLFLWLFSRCNDLDFGLQLLALLSLRVFEGTEEISLANLSCGDNVDQLSAAVVSELLIADNRDDVLEFRFIQLPPFPSVVVLFQNELGSLTDFELQTIVLELLEGFLIAGGQVDDLVELRSLLVRCAIDGVGRNSLAAKARAVSWLESELRRSLGSVLRRCLSSVLKRCLGDVLRTRLSNDGLLELLTVGLLFEVGGLHVGCSKESNREFGKHQFLILITEEYICISFIGKKT